MTTVFDRMTAEGAGQALHRLTLGRTVETGEDYQTAFHGTLAEAPEELLRAYAGRGPIDVAHVRKSLVALARALARQNGSTVEEELQELLSGEFRELARVYYTGRWRDNG